MTKSLTKQTKMLKKCVCFLKETEREWMQMRGEKRGEETLEGTEEGETATRVYYVKRSIFNKRKFKKITAH